ncbi:glycosyltransferase family 39 protein [candidate division KSB1 bacterium]|nr:glycosyltransferase family 39 protein [candidate division KSB1 bacterium]
MNNDKKIFYILIAILLVSAGLRFYSIHFGEPFRYHPDEVKLLSTAGRLLQSKFVDSDAYFAYGVYPVFFTLLLAVLIGVFIIMNILTGRFASFDDARILYENNPFPFLAVGRYFVAFLGICTVYVMYRLLKRMYNKTVAILGAALLAVNFVHVRNSHFSTVDVPATFFTLLGLYFCALIIEKPRLRYYLFAAVFIGWAFATKFSLFFLALPFIYAHFCASYTEKSFVTRLLSKNFWIGSVTGVVAFVLACPIIFLNFEKTWGGIMRTKNFESAGKIGSGGALLSYWTGQQSEGFGVFYPNSIPHTFGVLLTLIAVLGIFYLWIRHRKQDILLLAFFIPSYIMFEGMAYRAMRHILPLIPVILAAVAVFLGRLFIIFGSKKRKYIIVVTMLALLGSSVARTTFYLYYLGQPDPRSQALEWCLEHIPESSSVAVESFPPFLPGYNGNEVKGSTRYNIFEMNLLQKDSRLSSKLVKTIAQDSINYYIMDGFTRHVFDWEQTYRRYPEIIKDRQKFFQWLNSHSRIVAEFKPANDKIQPFIRIYRIMF